MSKVVNIHNTTKYTWGNDCISWVLNDHPNLSMKQEWMPAGSSEQLHYHEKTIQFFFVLEGIATFNKGTEVYQIQSFEGISILPFEKHFIANNGSDDLTFLVISHPNTLQDRINL